MESKLSQNTISKLLCAIGVGGFTTYSSLTRICKASLMDLPGAIILILSFFALALAAIMITNHNRRWFHIYSLVALTLIHVCSTVIVLVQGKIPNLYIVILWVSITYMIWILFDVLKLIHDRIRGKPGL